MNYLRVYLIVLFALFCQSLSAQCPGNPPLAFTFESTESRCESNGTITLHISGGTPFSDTNGNPIYNNTIIAPIVFPIGGQADSIFGALAADTYTMEVADANGCTVTHTIIVPGTHQQLTMTPTWGDAICDGSFGGWICAKPARGRPWPPGYYKYQLFDGATNPPTPITTVGLDSCFTNLAAGSYHIRAFDSCNNFQSRDIIIGSTAYAPTLRKASNWKYMNCDTSCLLIRASTPIAEPWGEFPFQWEVITAPSTVTGLIGQSGTWNAFNENKMICYSPMFLPQASTTNVRVTDACGKTTTITFPLPKFQTAATSGYACQTGSFFQIYDNNTYYCPQGTMTYEVFQAPSSYPIPPPQDSGLYTNLPNGFYRFRITDCCGNVDLKSVNISGPRWTAGIDDTAIFACVEGEIGFMVTDIPAGGAPINPQFELISVPLGYQGPVPDTFPDKGRILGPPGEYCVVLFDDCNIRTDTLCKTITDTLIYKPDREVISYCVTGNRVKVHDVTNIDYRYYFDRLQPSYLSIASNSKDTVWNNLIAGTYLLRTSSYHGQCLFENDTIIIPEYVSPQISGIWGIECDNGIGLITVEGSLGTAPYTYELFQGPTTRPVQFAPTFPGLPLGTYDVRINDVCNNSDIVTVDIEPFMPVIQGYGGAYCEGDTAFLYTDYFSLANYNWSGPNGQSSDTSVLMIPNISLADAGTYTIDIGVKNPDQSACIAQTLTIEIEVEDCDCPDLTPIISILPGNITGASSVGIAIEVTELTGNDTDGSSIIVRVPSDPRLVFTWDPGLTAIGFTPVNNANWNYMGDNGVVHLFQYNGPNGIIMASSTEAFGMLSIYDPQSTRGETTISSTIIPFSGGECNILNNTDAERLVYFE